MRAKGTTTSRALVPETCNFKITASHGVLPHHPPSTILPSSFHHPSIPNHSLSCVCAAHQRNWRMSWWSMRNGLLHMTCPLRFCFHCGVQRSPFAPSSTPHPSTRPHVVSGAHAVAHLCEECARVCGRSKAQGLLWDQRRCHGREDCAEEGRGSSTHCVCGVPSPGRRPCCCQVRGQVFL